MNAGASRIVQADDRGTIFQGHIQDFADFLGVHLTQATAKHGEVLGEYVNQAAINCSPTGDHAVAHELLLFQAKIIGTVNYECVDLPERAFIQEQVDTLSCSQAAALVLGFADGLIAMAATTFLLWSRSPLTRGIPLMVPSQLAEKALRENTTDTERK